jgi:hypothetical protein
MEVEPSDFHTRDFSFEDGVLFLFRKGHLYKKIPYDRVKSVVFKKGSDLRRPQLAVGFGILLLLFNAWILISAGFSLFQFFNTGLFFIAAVGLYAIYSGAPLHPVLEIRFGDEVESHSTATFIKHKTLDAFINFLQQELGRSKVTVKGGVTFRP